MFGGGIGFLLSGASNMFVVLVLGCDPKVAQLFFLFCLFYLVVRTKGHLIHLEFLHLFYSTL